jgi:NAD(P)H-dependent FMN reductase
MTVRRQRLQTAVSKLQVIIGSTRPTRAAERVIPWVVDRAVHQGAFDVEVLDLRDWPLPLFQEHRGTIGDVNDPTYSDPLVRSWNRKIKSADAFLVVTPEYLHSVPGALKNALDSVFVSFGMRNKPLGAVAYSTGVAAGVRAVEHLAAIAIEAESVPLRNSVLIPFVESAFDEHDRPKDPMTEAAMTVMLDDLAWWSALLERGRAEGELPPGTFRRMAILRDLAAKAEAP